MPTTQVYRILDASLNRAGEGLRVVEDYVRFVLDDTFLSTQVKTLRHDLAALAATIPSEDRHAARDTRRDVGTDISNEGETSRRDTLDVCSASLKRTEQSLRSIEEYGKLLNASVGRQAESLRYRLYTLEKAIAIGRTSQHRLANVRLCVLVDGCGSIPEFERLVADLVAAGVGMIQLREKLLDDRQLIERARLLVSLIRRQPPALPGVSDSLDRDIDKPPVEPGAAGFARCHTLAIINDRADIAAAAHADGVHLGQDDLTVKDARIVVGTQMLIGVSTHNIEQARRAVLDGANYLGAGPTFPSQTKNFEAFAGLDYLRQVTREIRLPTFAIGGITAENLPAARATGITRMAVAAAVTEADDPCAAATQLLSILNEASRNSCLGN